MEKNRLLAFTVLSAFAGVASAQTSSVTLYGTFDINARYVKTDGQDRRVSENSSGINSGQLGFRGEEDLGGGLKAGFILEAENVADSGSAGDGTRNKFWNRRSLVRLFGNWGEIRLGRDYAPSYWSHGIFDAFGNLGLGNMLNIHQMYNGTRLDNSIGFVLPAGLGGFYGDAKVAAGEGGTTFDRPGRYVGARVGYAAGPVNVAIAAGQQKFAVAWPGVGVAAGTGAPVLNNGALVPAPVDSTQKTYNIGGSYDFGVAKLIAFYDREQLLDARENLFSISAVVPLGQGEIHVAYDRSKLNGHLNAGGVSDGVGTAIDQIALGYVYNMSKRTALYTTISRLANKDATTATLPGSAGKATPAGKSQGAEFGIRHFF